MASRKWMGMLVAALMAAGSCAAEERVLRTEVVVHAPVSQVWKAFTTKEGVESWMAAVAEVDLRVGGKIRTNYNRAAKIGDPGTIVHHIVSYEPERMLATHFTAAPDGPSWAKTAEATWVVYRFEPMGEKETRVVVAMMGWGTGPQWDDSYEHFKRGNEWEMQQLVKRFDGAASEELMKGKGKGRVLEIKKTVACDPARAFAMWTTPDGLKQFFSESARIDPWPGGRYEIVFNPAVDPEAKSYGTGGARVLKFEPGRELAFEWVAFTLADGTKPLGGPPQMPAEVRNERPLPTWVDLKFEPAGGGTAVEFSYNGSREGGKWDESFAYFTNAWNHVMKNLETACAEKASLRQQVHQE